MLFKNVTKPQVMHSPTLSSLVRGWLAGSVRSALGVLRSPVHSGGCSEAGDERVWVFGG